MFTASTSAQKIFNGGIVTVGASVAKTNYEIQGPQASADFINKTFNEDAAFWLGPVYYFYTDGTYNIRDTDANFTSTASNSTAYRIIGGIGTRQFGLFRVSAYFGHQGSGASNSGSAGGNVYGGALTYYPTAAWTISANIDETINLAPAGAPPSTQAIGIPGITPLQIPLSSSTQITSASLHSSYTINPQWTLNGLFGYTHVENIGSRNLGQQLRCGRLCRIQYMAKSHPELGVSIFEYYDQPATVQRKSSAGYDDRNL